MSWFYFWGIGQKNQYTHVLCNELYTAFLTRRSKERLEIIDILSHGNIRFHFNSKSYALMKKMGVSRKKLREIKSFDPKEIMNKAEVNKFLDQVFTNPRKFEIIRQFVLEASAIVAYQSSKHQVHRLLTDDARQYKQIAKEQVLCWIHDGRHYKKLEPLIGINQTRTENFLNRYWDYYRRLLDYKEEPNKLSANWLAREFNKLFSTKTGYEELDERIQRTKTKKKQLLLVLKYPELPLHNNVSELGARVQARYRDISYHTMSEAGTKAKDTFMTIFATSRKLPVNAYEYVYDRISGQYAMPSLASLIKNASQAAV